MRDFEDEIYANPTVDLRESHSRVGFYVNPTGDLRESHSEPESFGNGTDFGRSPVGFKEKSTGIRQSRVARGVGVGV